VGYQFNNWLRGDITGQFRGNANFHGLDVITFNNGGAIGNGADTYSANKSEWLFLANAYADLGTWWCITPFVGAGIGTARVQVSNFVDQGVGSLPGGGVGPSTAFADTASKWNFAWALHAGLGYKVSPNMTIEVAYSYINMGDGITGDLKTFDGTNAVFNPMTFRNITSQDLTLGVRWQFDNPAPVYQPPLVTKG
jgi:opacity protein-like surface antigen